MSLVADEGPLSQFQFNARNTKAAHLTDCIMLRPYIVLNVAGGVVHLSHIWECYPLVATVTLASAFTDTERTPGSWRCNCIRGTLKVKVLRIRNPAATAGANKRE